jgi:hypothetical protein
VPRLVRRFPSESHKYPGAGRALEETGAPIGGISISVVLFLCLFCFVSSFSFFFRLNIRSVSSLFQEHFLAVNRTATGAAVIKQLARVFE